MSEAPLFSEQHPAPAARRRLSAKATWTFFIAAALVVVAVAVVLVWSQIRDAETTHVIDDEAGLSYSIPQDWVQLSEAEMTVDSGYAMYSSIAEAPGNAWVRFRVAGADSHEDALSFTKALVADFTGGDLDSPSIVEEDSVIDGHAATTFSDSDDEGLVWMSMLIEFDDRWVEVWGAADSDDPHFVEQLESIFESIRIS
ncbi:hypothetical protein [Glycomyces buryatensis]|uniref:Uncharacterized protein n=1 Tax=Glycomyces buryatensis TaxID=2570927 RepID=A0A4S8QC57_9ACTN|nr:hypothetical protein [Glycomyces buryatensis]THV41938.1 hypothetical protein FAB82_09485 [Glycomyces buryatensis]